MKLSPTFKDYLKDLEGYRNNKIENPSLTYEAYQIFSRTREEAETIELSLEEIKKLNPHDKLDEGKIYHHFLKIKREFRNYQNVVKNFLINDEFLNRKLTIEDIKEMSGQLLDGLTVYPLNVVKTIAFQQRLDSKTQEWVQDNVPGEFRKTDVQKGKVVFRPWQTIEQDLQKILDETYGILESKKASIETKIDALVLFHLNFQFILLPKEMDAWVEFCLL